MGKKKYKIPVRSIIVAIIVFSITIYFLMICFEGLKKNYVEDGWQLTSGVVLSPDKAILGKRNIDRKRQGIEQTINYKYTINGIDYESNSVSREIYVNKDDYPDGKTVNVYYSPTNHTDTVLVRTNVQKRYLYGMIGFCIIVLGVTVFSLIRDFKNG